MQFAAFALFLSVKSRGEGSKHTRLFKNIFFYISQTSNMQRAHYGTICTFLNAAPACRAILCTAAFFCSRTCCVSNGLLIVVSPFSLSMLSVSIISNICIYFPKQGIHEVYVNTRVLIFAGKNTFMWWFRPQKATSSRFAQFLFANASHDRGQCEETKSIFGQWRKKEKWKWQTCGTKLQHTE